MAVSPIVLPIVTVQHDFPIVISDVQDGTVPSEDFWVSCYKTSETSVHGKVGVSRAPHGHAVELTSRLGVQFERGTAGSYTVACESLAIQPTRIRLPRQVYRDAGRSDSIHIATGYNDGSIQTRSTTSYHQTDAASVTTTYKPHLTSITSLRFFPSSRVLLAAAADFSLTILDADGSTAAPSTTPARTLRGHRRSVTDTAIISRGRNVLSCAKDGTVRLWDVGTAAQIRVIGVKGYAPVFKMSLGTKGEEWGRRVPDGEEEVPAPTPKTDAREVDTGDKLLFCALGDGHFEAIDLMSKNSVYHSGHASGNSSQGDTEATKSQLLSAIAYSSGHDLVATGSSKGVISIYDTRSLSKTLTSFSRNEASIEDLSFMSFRSSKALPQDHEEVGLVVATEDGLPYVAGVRPEGPDVLAELVGGDCEGVRVIRIDNSGGIWTAGDDGDVRLY